MLNAMTCIINGNAYKLNEHDVASFASLLADDKKRLIALGKAIEQHDKKSNKHIEQTIADAKSLHDGGAKIAQHEIKPERMSGSDIDALMKKLIIEEQQNKKPAMTKGRIYKYIAIVVAIIALLVLLF